MATSKHTFALALCGLALLSATASAQTLSIDPAGVLQGGSTVSIGYDNPSRAGQTIVVVVSGGFPIPTAHEVVIQLDTNGRGVSTWTVDGTWRSANFDAPDVKPVTVPVV